MVTPFINNHTVESQRCSQLVHQQTPHWNQDAYRQKQTRNLPQAIIPHQFDTR